MSYYLITDGQGTCAERIEQVTGLRAYDTHLGILVEKPKPFELHGAMAALERRLNPMRCSCGPGAVVHHGNCPLMYAVT